MGLYFKRNLYAIQSHEANIALAAHRLDSLCRIGCNKIIILGGSGCGFGFQSYLLSIHFDMPVVNTGTHAGLGSYVYCNLYRKFIQQGDIVLLIPEYDMFANCYSYGSESQHRILVNNYPKGLLLLTLKQHKESLKSIPQYFRHSFSHGHVVNDNSPYAKTQLNKYGDVTGWEWRKHKYKGRDVIPYPKEESISFFVSFIEDCKQTGASIFLFPPAYNQSNYEANHNQIIQIEQILSQKGIPYCAHSCKYALPDSLFFDTSYHLTQKGVEFRTNAIIQDLDSLLNIKRRS